MAQASVRGPLGEADFGDQARAHPVHRTLAGNLAIDWPSLRRQRLQPAQEGAARRAVEAGADPPGVGEPAAVLCDREQEGAELVVALPLHSETNDHELLATVALDLQPVPPAPGPVGRVGAFAHDTLEPAGAGGAPARVAPAGLVATETKRRRRRQALEELAQSPLALDQRQRPEVFSVHGQEVEGLEA